MSSRVRTTGPGFSFPFPSSIVRTTCAGVTSTVSSSTAGVEVGSLKVTTDVVTPKFRSRSSKGEIINNPFSSVLTEKSGSASGALNATFNGTCSGSSTRSETQTNWITGGSPPTGPWPALDSAISQARRLAGTQAAAGVAAPDVQGLVDLAELRKTLSMLRRPLGSLGSMITRIKNSKRYRRWLLQNPGKGFADFMSSEWLRYRYGILPLVFSIQGALKALNDGKRPLRVTSRGRASVSVSPETKVSSSTYSWSVATITGSRSAEVTCRAGILYEYQSDMGSRFGVGLQEVPAAAYELIPYSFVVDWFLNLGDFISAISPKVGVRELASWTTVTVKELYESEERSSPRVVPNWTISDNRLGTQTVRVTRVTRTPGVSVGVTYIPITFTGKKDWLHLADAVSLIYAQLRR
ncbi:TPA_asm: maturation protein [ssRNA phage SRR6255733_3]|uniref:Maturation protein n=1 Tax=ssRNA phage SRR6255733_3 TaxID=2786499 RepID=A0A8S5L0U4_9VIRU|nr:maturation protein [ssRNA phage SRR6255733_3]DAD50949.1 TPA_asm: maturation protein [ssRNA phage SRR6255733_3]